MENIILSLIVNGMMAVMLLVTILYCGRLNKRIQVLQDSKSELATIIREFDESTRRATESISEIHAATNRLSDNIQHKIDKANFLADDLQYMIEKGSKLSGKAEPAMERPRPSPMPTNRAAQVAAAAGQSAPAAPEEAAEGGAGTPRRARLRSKAEQQLMQVLGNKQEG